MKSNLKYRDDGRLIPSDQPYEMTLGDIERVFGHQNHDRRNIFSGLKIGVLNLISAGVERIVLGGSFITQIDAPRDVDGVWYYSQQVNLDLVDPVFLGSKVRAKAKFLMDFRMELIEDVLSPYGREEFLKHNTRLETPASQVGVIKIVY